MTEAEKEKSRRYYAANKDKAKAATKKWKDANKERQIQYRRELCLRQYGLTTEQFDAMLSAQENACAICGTKDPEGRHNVFHVDHSHTTQRVRGLLCNLCNVGLGAFKDAPAALRKAATYLEGHAR